MTRKKKDDVIEAVVLEETPKRKNKKHDKQEEVIIDEVVATSTNHQKPYFFPRLVAYIIDIMLVSTICTGILFVLPENKNYSKYMKEYEQIQTDYIEEKIDADEYLNKSMDVVYDIDYSNIMSMFVEVILIILYFIVFQFYNKGQTFGKKLMKLRVVSTDGDSLTLNQVAIRAAIINSIFVNILIIGSLLFLGRNYYYYASSVIQGISLIITFITLVMIFSRKDGKGLHDYVASTQVIQEI